MSTESLQASSLRRARTIADYQFGSGAGEALFPESAGFQYSTTRRIRYILLDGTRLATVRASDGRLTLSIEGAERLWTFLPPPAYRVTVLEDVAPFVGKGKNAMAKHVLSADEGILAGDEVLVVLPDDTLIATGSAVLCGSEMVAFNYGVAVQVRSGRLV
ncbi:MAG TPA: pseudouridine synthase [Methanoculleus sp.]|nr:pseudouridine synthase [Methanoculleus sp.]